MKRSSNFVTGLGIGAASVFFLDSKQGKRRRTTFWDQTLHFGRQAARGVSLGARDLTHRTLGIISETKSALFSGDEIPDNLLTEHVRSRLGRIVSHPHAIQVTAMDGYITLYGAILETELERLIFSLSHLRGVKGIENRLESHKTDENIPALQGGKIKQGQRLDIFQTKWSPATRFVVGFSGTALSVYGYQKRNTFGALLSSFGVISLFRSITNLEVRRLFGLGGKQSIVIHKTINISAPVERVYDFWSNLENLPQLIREIKNVKMGPEGLSHWTLTGPAGTPIQWDAVTTRQVPNQLIAWRSAPGAMIQNAGRVRFFRNEDGNTKIELDFSYTPPVGALGHYLAKLFGSDAKTKIDDALMQMKSMIEQNRPFPQTEIHAI